MLPSRVHILRHALQHIMAQAGSTPSLGSPMGFLDLPAELRNQIYSLALTIDEHIWIKHRNPRPTTSYAENYDLDPVHLPVPLLRTCKAIHTEATPILYGSNNFRMYDFQGRLCLSRLGTNFPYLRHIGLITTNRGISFCLETFKSLGTAACLVELALEGCTSPSCPPGEIVAAFEPIALFLIKAGQYPTQVANVILFCIRYRERNLEEQDWRSNKGEADSVRSFKFLLERELGLQKEDEDSNGIYESYDAEEPFLDWLEEFQEMQKETWDGTQLY